MSFPIAKKITFSCPTFHACFRQEGLCSLCRSVEPRRPRCFRFLSLRRLRYSLRPLALFPTIQPGPVLLTFALAYFFVAAAFLLSSSATVLQATSRFPVVPRGCPPTARSFPSVSLPTSLPGPLTAPFQGTRSIGPKVYEFVVLQPALIFCACAFGTLGARGFSHAFFFFLSASAAGSFRGGRFSNSSLSPLDASPCPFLLSPQFSHPPPHSTVPLLLH